MSANKAEQAVAYAALILADEGIEITPEKLQSILSAAGIEDVEPIWTSLFAKALAGKDVKEILTKVAASGPAIGEAEVTPQKQVENNKDSGDDADAAFSDDEVELGDMFGDGLFG